MKTKMITLILGAVLIVIAVILGGIQISHAYNIYGAAGHKWYFYGAVAIIGIIGIILGSMERSEESNTKENHSVAHS